jgi:hypothetical protein
MTITNCVTENNYFGVIAMLGGVTYVGYSTIVLNRYGLYADAAKIYSNGNNAIEANSIQNWSASAGGSVAIFALH